MSRVRRARPVGSSPELVEALAAIRRVPRSRPAHASAEEDSEAVESAQHGVDMDDSYENLNENPDTRGEDETAQEAGDRIEAKYKARATSPLKAIRAFCVICVGCYPREVAKCTAVDCALHPFRHGKNPYQKHTPK